MRCLATLLLLLCLPGLVLPAGLRLRWCLCASVVVTNGGPRSCCKPAAEATTPPCCRHHERTPGGQDERLPVASDGRCGCTWLQVPEHKPEPAPPDVATSPFLDLPPLLVAFVPPAPSPSHRVVPDAIAYHPPPGHARNLPLLL